MTTNVVTKPRSPAGMDLARQIVAEVLDPADFLLRAKVQGSALLECDQHVVERGAALKAVQLGIAQTEQRCARVAVDVSRAKADRYRQGVAPAVAIAAVEATGADIEHEIVHGIPRLDSAGVEANGQALTDECASARFSFSEEKKGGYRGKIEEQVTQPAANSTLPPAVPFLLPATATHCAVCGERIAAKARVFAVIGDNDKHFGLVTTTLGEFAGSRERTVFLDGAICAKRYAMQWVDRVRACAPGADHE